MKISPSHLFVTTTTTSLPYLTSACLPLPYPAKVSALSLPTSSFPAHSAYTTGTDIPLTVCLQYPFFLPTCVAFPLSGLNSSFCPALCSQVSFLWLSFLVSSCPLSYLALLLAPAWFLAPPGSFWPCLWFSLPSLF